MVQRKLLNLYSISLSPFTITVIFKDDDDVMKVVVRGRGFHVNRSTTVDHQHKLFVRDGQLVAVLAVRLRE